MDLASGETDGNISNDDFVLGERHFALVLSFPRQDFQE